MFWQTEGRRVRTAFLTVLGAYGAILVIMFAYAWMAYFGADSYFSWLSPWPAYGAGLSAVVLVIWLITIGWSYSKKEPCHSCKVMTKYVDDDDRPVCRGCYRRLAKQTRYDDARKRADAEPVYACPKCSLDHDAPAMMTKHFAEVAVGSAVVVIDVCGSCGGEFRDADEIELLDRALRDAGYADGYNAGRSSGNSNGIVTGLVIGMAID